jgi:hypothetical protein
MQAGVQLMTLRVFDPSNEMKAAGGEPAVRPSSLRGKTVGFISNGKEGTKGYFAHLDRMLRQDFGVADVVWRTKSNYSAPADAHIIDEIKKWHAVVTGVGD